MVNIGTLEMGVNLDGAEELTKMANEMEEELGLTEETAGEVTVRMENLSERTDETAGIMGTLRGKLESLVTWFNLTDDETDGFLDGTRGQVEGVKEQAGGLLSKLTGLGGLSALGGGGVIGSIASAVGGLSATTATAAVGIGAAIGGIVTELTGLTDFTSLSMDSVKSAFSGAADFLSDVFSEEIDSVKSDYNKLISGIQDTVPDFNIGNLKEQTPTFKIPFPDIPEFGGGVGVARGARTTNTTNQNVTNKTVVQRPTVKFEDSGISDMSKREQRELAKSISLNLGDEIKKRID